MLPKDNGKKAQTTSGIVLLIVVLLLMIVYYLWMVYRENDTDVEVAIITIPDRSVTVSTEADMPTPELEKYRDDKYGFELSYTDDWSVESETTGSQTTEIHSITLSRDADSVTINIMDPDMEGLVRNSITSTTETTLTISGNNAIRLDGSSSKDGSSISVLLVKKSGSLYSIQGSGDGFDEIVNGFQFR